MRTCLLFLAISAVVMATTGHGEDLTSMFDNGPAVRSVFTPADTATSLLGGSWDYERTAFAADGLAAELFARGEQPFGLLADPLTSDFADFVVRGQSPSGSGGEAGGQAAGAAAATDPSVPLTQMQFQNVFVPSTYNASGYSNQFILQPVVPIHLNSKLFPYHIMRPTLPVIAPTADPDGPAEVQGGLGDLTLLDVYLHPIKRLKTNIGFGYVAVFPTATHPQLGLQEWQFGPTALLLTTAIPKWNLGLLAEVPMSLESNAYKVQAQIVAVRMLPHQWYAGWGDLLWTLDDQNGTYDLPLSVRVGKVVSIGKHKLNIFLQPQYTPDGLHSGPTSEWAIKLNVTFLFPKAKFGPLFGCDSCCCD